MRPNTLRSFALLGAACALAACQEPTAVESAAVAQPHFTTTYGAELLECPTDVTQRGSATIGFLGGTVAAGGTTVSIPAGALLLPTSIDVVVPASNYVEVRITAGGQEHFAFRSPVAIAIDYSRCTRGDIEHGALRAYYIDAVSKALLEEMPATDDRTNRKVRFETDHLSSYAVAY